MVLLKSSLWRVSLILVLNRSLLHREYILINVLKALASIISIYNLHVTEIFYAIYKCNISSIWCEVRLRRSTTARKVNPRSLILIYCNSSAHTRSPLSWDRAGVFWQQNPPFKRSVKRIPHFIARQRLGKQVPTATNTREYRDCGKRVSIYLPVVAR
jgi:hypothetical protein